jgi:hypothetical protein
VFRAQSATMYDAEYTFWDRLRNFFGKCSCASKADIVYPGAGAAPEAAVVEHVEDLTALTPVPMQPIHYQNHDGLPPIDLSSPDDDLPAMTSPKFATMIGLVESTSRIPTRNLTGDVAPLIHGSRSSNLARLMSAPTTPSILSTTESLGAAPQWMTPLTPPPTSSPALNADCARVGFALREFGTLRSFLTTTSAVSSHTAPASELLNR